MASTVKHRPLPALIALLALLLLTALVWWRVLDRSDGATKDAKPCPTTTTAPAVVLPAPSAVTVQVLNSTNRLGIATKARAVLTEIGFDIPSAAGNDNRKLLNKIKTTGQIRYGPAQARSARLIGYYLPGATLVPTTSKSATVVVSLGTRYRGIASAASVAASQKRDNVVAGTPTPVASASASCAS